MFFIYSQAGVYKIVLQTSHINVGLAKISYIFHMEVTAKTKEPIRRSGSSKSSNKLKVECLLAWNKDHKAFKPKPSILPNNVDDLSEKFKVQKTKS